MTPRFSSTAHIYAGISLEMKVEMKTGNKVWARGKVSR